MNFKLPHDIVSTCAKRDEPPSRRRPSRSFPDQNHILSTNSSEQWPTSARLLFLPCIQWTAKNSYYYCSISCFLTKILHCAFLSCEAFSDHLNSQAMDFKLPHDILCCRAAHDNRRADGGLSDFLPDQNIILSTNSSEPWPTSARHSVSSVYSVDYQKFVCIRVNSWFLKNDLVAA